eukprot:scaffold42673_cov29-Prasinocladus_malaysianus.AAC.1
MTQPEELLHHHQRVGANGVAHEYPTKPASPKIAAAAYTSDTMANTAFHSNGVHANGCANRTEEQEQEQEKTTPRAEPVGETRRALQSPFDQVDAEAAAGKQQPEKDLGKSADPLPLPFVPFFSLSKLPCWLLRC